MLRKAKHRWQACTAKNACATGTSAQAGTLMLPYAYATARSSKHPRPVEQASSLAQAGQTPLPACTSGHAYAPVRLRYGSVEQASLLAQKGQTPLPACTSGDAYATVRLRYGSVEQASSPRRASVLACSGRPNTPSTSAQARMPEPPALLHKRGRLCYRTLTLRLGRASVRAP